jgi:hypothetical protein
MFIGVSSLFGACFHAFSSLFLCFFKPVSFSPLAVDHLYLTDALLSARYVQESPQTAAILIQAEVGSAIGCIGPGRASRNLRKNFRNLCPRLAPNDVDGCSC